jgi:ABC-2 type transport system ATP-binding protein
METVLFSIQNIKKEYNSEHGIKKALKGISFSIYEAETIALLGINGAGKTTLSSILATLHPATSGEIFFKEKPLMQNLMEYRKELGFCPQKSNLNPSISCRENLIFAARYYGVAEHLIQEKVAVVMEKLKLTAYADKYTYELSGGYKQRFLIARSLLHDPKVIILDEPTVALDPHIRHQLWDTIKELKATGTTIILTTHYLDEAEVLADRVCILDQGLIKLIDNPENLKKSFQKTNLEGVFLQLLEEN